MKERLGLTDRETVETLQENPYLQFFLGLEEFTQERPFDATADDQSDSTPPGDNSPPTPSTSSQQSTEESRTQRVDNRIVSVAQPHVRPIKRGKAGRDTEFGAKLSLSVVDGFSFINRLSWDSYNEGSDLVGQIETYRRRFGCYPESVHVDIEGKFGQGKRRFGLGRIMAKLASTSAAQISLSFLVINLERALRQFFFSLVLLGHGWERRVLTRLYGCSRPLSRLRSFAGVISRSTRRASEITLLRGS